MEYSQIIQDESMIAVRSPKLMKELADEQRLLGGNGYCSSAIFKYPVSDG